ncbi:GNAT family N-acetyltransferase [Methylopila musalis]|uniref:GNAT family N-acetyltransferase n=1 Tax=Methylopila musalis TaxID=1134781 RepID=A0ABW3Z502_9HYPH
MDVHHQTAGGDAPPLGPEVATHRAAEPVAVTLRGAEVTLGPLDPARDAAELFPLVSGPENARLFAYLVTGPFATEAELRADLEAAVGNPKLATFAIRDAATGRALGRACYMRAEPAHRTVEVGAILFAPALQRRRAGTEAMALMARHAFETLGYRRYEWKCDALNAPSRAAALRLGFRFEGVFARHMIVKGRSRDTAWFAMTGDDWPRISAAFDAWLAPDNFDSTGRQRQRLEDVRAGL